ncbi:MAG: hypothetical protein MPL62_18045 [Alphaproteobacteria bacterium]|nr:hypothetical protein [Alphaproteobacteria bacterium]
MKMLKKFFSLIGELAVAICVLVAVLVLIPAVADTPDFWDKNPEILIALVIGLLPSAIVLHVQNRTEKRERHKWLLEKRATVLAGLISAFGKMFKAGRFSTTLAERQQKTLEIQQVLMDNKSDVIAWAPISVIRAWKEMEAFTFDGGALNATNKSLMETIESLDKVFRVIRKELDHDDSSLKKGELVGVFLSDEARKHLEL